MKIFTWTTGILGLIVAGVGVFIQWRSSKSSGGETTVLPIVGASVGQPSGITTIVPAVSTTPAATTPTPKPEKPKKPNPRKDRYSETAINHRNNL